MLVETDRDRMSAVNQIIEFYKRQNTDYAAYFEAAWRFKHRGSTNRAATLESLAAGYSAAQREVATTIWRTLEQSKETVGPLARLGAGGRSRRHSRAVRGPTASTDYAVRGDTPPQDQHRACGHRGDRPE